MTGRQICVECCRQIDSEEVFIWHYNDAALLPAFAPDRPPASFTQPLQVSVEGDDTHAARINVGHLPFLQTTDRFFKAHLLLLCHYNALLRVCSGLGKHCVLVLDAWFCRH